MLAGNFQLSSLGGHCFVELPVGAPLTITHLCCFLGDDNLVSDGLVHLSVGWLVHIWLSKLGLTCTWYLLLT